MPRWQSVYGERFWPARARVHSLYNIALLELFVLIVTRILYEYNCAGRNYEEIILDFTFEGTR